MRLSSGECHQIIEVAAEGVWVIDKSDRTRYVNDKMAQMLGYEPHELIGRKPHEFVPDSHLDYFEQTLIKRRQGQKDRYEMCYRRKDGSTCWVIIAGATLYDEQGQFNGSIGVHTDISSRIETETRLKLSEERLRYLIAQAPIGIQTFSLDGTMISCNPGWEALWNTPSPVVEQYNILKDPQVEQIGALPVIKRAFAGELVEVPPVHYNPASSHMPGRPRWVEGVMYPVKIDHAITEIVFLQWDVTKLHELLEQEQRARVTADQANRMKDEFAAIIAHELRNPLSLILGYTQLLQGEDLPGFNKDHALKSIQKGANRLAQLINDLVDSSRYATGKFTLSRKDIDLREIVEQVVQSFGSDIEAKDLHLEMTLGPRPLWVSGDELRLSQVIWNLISNAIKFTPSGGCVWVTAEVRPSVVRIAVRDSGKGITPSGLNTIFERFVQEVDDANERHQGLGLGLFIVRQIVELHGGRAQVESAGPGKGSCFTIEIPNLRDMPPAIAELEQSHSIN